MVTAQLLRFFLALFVPADSAANEPIAPIPLQPIPAEVEKVALGEHLFSDKRLSHDGSISCESCHLLRFAGNDGRSVAKGIGGAVGARNVPSVFNAALNFRQFWDGRASTLQEQAGFPITNPEEMGSSWPEIIDKLSADEEMRTSFQRIYREGITEMSIKDAIAAFEFTLTTPNSRFDRYLRGDETAISETERQGYELFKRYGCVACHQGVNIGGNMFQVFGVMSDLAVHRNGDLAADLGRFPVTQDDADRHVFKVPSLRNVAVTAPYFHNGSVPTLEEAVDVMFTYQLGRAAPKEDKARIVQFLRTLTGEFRGRRLVAAGDERRQ